MHLNLEKFRTHNRTRDRRHISSRNRLINLIEWEPGVGLRMGLLRRREVVWLNVVTETLFQPCFYR